MGNLRETEKTELELVQKQFLDKLKNENNDNTNVKVEKNDDVIEIDDSSDEEKKKKM